MEQSTATTFAPFQKLPTELQIQIWKDAIPEPGIILLRPNFAKEDHLSVTFRTSTIPSGLLGAYRLSRDIILKAFDTCIDANDKGGKIRFNGRHNTIVLWSDTPLSWSIRPKNNKSLKSQLRSVTRLAVHMNFKRCGLFECGPVHEEWILSHFTGLEHLTLFLDDPYLFPYSTIDGGMPLRFQPLEDIGSSYAGLWGKERLLDWARLIENAKRCLSSQKTSWHKRYAFYYKGRDQSFTIPDISLMSLLKYGA